jgi:hypothetical protein
MLTDAARRHVWLYRTLRAAHPVLFSDLRRHRAASDLGTLSKWLYPLVFGPRPPLSLRTRAQALGTRAQALLGAR